MPYDLSSDGPSDGTDYDLSSVIDDRPINLKLLKIKRQYVRLRSAAAALVANNPDLKALLAAERAGDYVTEDALINNAPTS